MKLEGNPNLIVIQGSHLWATNEELDELFQRWTAYEAFWQAASVRIDKLLRRLSAARYQAPPPPAKRRRPKPLRRVVWPRADLQIAGSGCRKGSNVQ